MQPTPDQVSFDLRAVLDAVVMLHAEVPDDAFTAPILGTERIGSGTVIRNDGLVLTIGYLVTEAESLWITANDGTVVQAHPVAYDFPTGFGLVQPLGKLNVPVMPRGTSAHLQPGSDILVVGHGGVAHALNAHVVAKREFAGYWEYVLDEAIYTTPPHPEWGGAALVDDEGRLAGIGSLLVQEGNENGTGQGNMFVPIDLLEPILDDLLMRGRRAAAPRPWLGLYASEFDGRVVLNGIAPGGPAQRAGMRVGDVVLEVAGNKVNGLAQAFRAVWALGDAGTAVPLTIDREGAKQELVVRSTDRNELLRKPQLQ